MELECVCDQVLEQLTHLEGTCRHGGKPTDDHAPMTRSDALVEVGKHFGDNLAQVDGLRRLRANGHLRVLQKIRDQNLHPAGGVCHSGEVVASLIVKRARRMLGKPIAEGLNLPEWLLQVMRRDCSEVVQLPVAPFELLADGADSPRHLAGRALVADDDHRACDVVFAVVDRRYRVGDGDLVAIAANEEAARRKMFGAVVSDCGLHWNRDDLARRRIQDAEHVSDGSTCCLL